MSKESRAPSDTLPKEAAPQDTAKRIVLASGSAARRALLRNAGILFDTHPATIDERAVEASLVEAGKSPQKIAAGLAEAKALSVAEKEPDALVIGADQVLVAGRRRWNKPADLAEARTQLVALSGKTHRLVSAVAIATNATVVWRHHEVARMTMRRLTPEFIDIYLSSLGEAVLTSVGAYQVEGEGIQLFERIEGDYFAILGLPLLPLLAFLRKRGVLQ